MKFSEKFDSEEYIVKPGRPVKRKTGDGIEKETIIYKKEPGKCKGCEGQTNFYDSFFDGFVCSEDCSMDLLEQHRKYVDDQEAGGDEGRENPIGWNIPEGLDIQ